MKKFIFYGICALSLLWFFSVADLSNSNNLFVNNTAKAATTGNVNLSGTVTQYMILSFTSGSTISLGNITPGVGACNGSGTIASVTTNSENGYELGLSDGSDTNSAMSRISPTAFIPDLNGGSMGVPGYWSTGSSQGLGAGLFAADTTKETRWGTGTTACDVWNKWASVPSAATAGHAVTGYRAGADTSSWGWKVDVPNTQPTGIYTGNVLFTAVETFA